MAFIELQQVEEKELAPGFRVRFVHTETNTFGYFRVTAGAKLPAHAHPHVQVTTILSGEFELTVDGETRVLTPGMVATIPSDSPHAGRAVTDCFILDVFSPVREDYR